MNSNLWNFIDIYVYSFIVLIFSFIIKYYNIFLARKLGHILFGLIFLFIIKYNDDNDDNKLKNNVLICSLFIFLISISTFLSKYFFFNNLSFRLYIFSVLLWLCLSIPFKYLTPLFFADPIGAIIGFYGPNTTKWIFNKTYLGTFTIILVSFIVLVIIDKNENVDEKEIIKCTDEINKIKMLLWAFLIGIVEGITGSYDNLSIPLLLIFKYLIDN